MTNRSQCSARRPLSAAFAFFSAARFYGALRFYYFQSERLPASGC